MYAQVGDFCVSRGSPTVTLTQISRKAGTLCCQSFPRSDTIWPIWSKLGSLQHSHLSNKRGGWSTRGGWAKLFLLCTSKLQGGDSKSGKTLRKTPHPAKAGSWGPFLIYQLISNANSVQFHSNRAGLAVLIRVLPV